MTRTEEMKKAMANLDSMMNAMGFKTVKVTCATEAEMKKVMKQYGYPYLVGGYAYDSIDTLGQKDRGVKVSKVNGMFTAKFTAFAR